MNNDMLRDAITELCPDGKTAPQNAVYMLGFRDAIAKAAALATSAAPGAASVDLGLAKLTVEQLKARLANAEAHIERLEAAAPSSGESADEYAATAADWPEDFPHENGNYESRCSDCGIGFMGHKRRTICKVCAGRNNRAATESAGFVVTSEWQLYADHFKVNPEAIDYDSDKWNTFVAGVNAGRNDRPAPAAHSSAPSEAEFGSMLDDFAVAAIHSKDCSKLKRELIAYALAAPAPTGESLSAAPQRPYGYWMEGEWYGYTPGEHADGQADGATFELTPVWTHGKPVTFRWVSDEDSDDFDCVPDTPEDAALLARYADLAAPTGSSK